jgi:hypothetical protein
MVDATLAELGTSFGRAVQGANPSPPQTQAVPPP